jgi:hypothetical protein
MQLLSFLTSAKAFRKTLQEVVVRKSYSRDRIIFARESAYVRIWPGVLGITDLELEAIEQSLTDEFLELEIEVMQCTWQGDQAPTIKA